MLTGTSDLECAAKYGIKIAMLCDTITEYMNNVFLCRRKSTNIKGQLLWEYYVTELTRSIHGSNHNVTMDNWFASVPLAEKLLNYTGYARKKRKSSSRIPRNEGS